MCYCTVMKNLFFWIECLRAYSLPMSIMAWVIPFCYGLVSQGNIWFGLIALIGIICVHLGANLFDDIIDYKNALIKQENKFSLNLKKGKCKFFIENKISIKNALLVAFALFGIASIIGLYFIYLYNLPIIILMTITGFLCLLYPKSGYFGLSEIIISTIFSPLLFVGVYYVMNANISLQLILLSISFAFVTMTLLYTDFFLDYETDKIGGKMTIPILCRSKKNAYLFYIFIIFLIYSNIALGVLLNIFSATLLIVFLSIIPAMKTVKNLHNYIDKELTDEKEFLKTMNDVQKYIAIFTLLCIICIIIA